MSLVVVSVAAVGALGEADADDRVNGFHWVLHQDEVAQHDVKHDQLRTGFSSQGRARLRAARETRNLALP